MSFFRRILHTLTVRPIRHSLHHRQLLLTALFGFVLLWLSFPPCEFFPLAWLAPIPWIYLIRKPQLLATDVRGVRGFLTEFFTLYPASCFYWLVVLFFIALAHPLLFFAYVPASLLMGTYFPAFIVLSRQLVHRPFFRNWRLPVLLAAPIVFCALEWVQEYLYTGTSFGQLAHSQYRWPEVLQISELGGSILLSGVMVFVATCLQLWAPQRLFKRFAGRPSWLPLVPCVLVLAVVLGWGKWRMSIPPGEPLGRVALIQGNFQPEERHDDSDAKRINDWYLSQSLATLKKEPNLDLIIWPECAYISNFYDFPDAPRYLATQEEYAGRGISLLEDNLAYNKFLFNQAEYRLLGATLGVPLLTGTTHAIFPKGKTDQEAPAFLNSAVLIRKVTPQEKKTQPDRVKLLLPPERLLAFTPPKTPDLEAYADYRVTGVYDKIHRVPFGEYLPFADYLTWLYKWFPILERLRVAGGNEPQLLKAGKMRISADICYEGLLSRQVRENAKMLEEQNGAERSPNVLVNLSNDNWYRGTWELEFHLACSVVRAIENRRPYLFCTNAGHSAVIDGSGVILAEGERCREDVIVANVYADPRESFYFQHGAWWGKLCSLIVVLGVLLGWWTKARQPRGRSAQSP